MSPVNGLRFSMVYMYVFMVHLALSGNLSFKYFVKNLKNCNYILFVFFFLRKKNPNLIFFLESQKNPQILLDIHPFRGLPHEDYSYEQKLCSTRVYLKTTSARISINFTQALFNDSTQCAKLQT